MFSLWRPHCWHATRTTRTQIARITYSKDKPALLRAFRGNVTLRVMILQRYSSHLKENVRLESFRTHGGISIKSGDTAELEDGSFLRVKDVLHNEYYNRYWVVGWRFIRNRKTCGLPRHDPVNPNEVYWVVHLVKNDPRPAVDQALVKLEGSQILRKKTMIMVNTTYPTYKKGTGADLGESANDTLFCRWKHVFITKTSKLERPLDAFHIPAREIVEASHQRLRTEECDDGHNSRNPDETLRRLWQGVTRRGGANVESKESDSLLSAVEALSLNEDSPNESAPAAYTFADICCGAGGASHGAKMAGLQLRWALDNDAPACDTFHLNFPEVQLYCKGIEDVAQMQRGDLKVDIQHFSPPCQAYSQANTTPNLKKDALNIAANRQIRNCLDKARPRIATLEQTSGLMIMGHAGGRHKKHWSNLTEQFTSTGYSVGWKVMNLVNLGLPQHRKRLIMIASR